MNVTCSICRREYVVEQPGDYHCQCGEKLPLPEAIPGKRCPYCKETVNADAQKCRYCGEWFNPPTFTPPEIVRAFLLIGWLGIVIFCGGVVLCFFPRTAHFGIAVTALGVLVPIISFALASIISSCAETAYNTRFGSGAEKTRR